MPRCERGSVHIYGKVKEGFELNLRVAKNIRVRGAPFFVFVKEVAEDPVIILLGEIDGIEGDAYLLGDTLCVLIILGRSAYAVIIRFIPILHENAHNIITLPLEKQGCGG